jgi:hypothetical protein
MMSNEDVISFKQFLSETIRNLSHFIHCPKDGPKLKWESITEMDFKIMKGILSENDYYSEDLSNFMADIDNKEEYNNKDSENRNEDRAQDFRFEIDVKNQSNIEGKGIQRIESKKIIIISVKNPFLKIQNVTKNLTLEVMVICYLVMFYTFFHIFLRTKYISPEDNWILFANSTLVILTQTIIRSDIHYCVLGRGRVRDLNFLLKFLVVLLMMDLAVVTRILLILIPLNGLSFGKFLLLMMCSYKFVLQLLVFVVLRKAKCKTRKYKSKLANDLLKKNK